jgi:hypothetical protein
MTRDEWLQAFAEAAGAAPPRAEDAEILLELAGIAAHSSERTAAPLTCWIAARAGLTIDRAIEIARQLEATATASDDQKG